LGIARADSDAVAWREAAFMTAVAIAPVAAVWLVSQGS
jgi:hypothetical protein